MRLKFYEARAMGSTDQFTVQFYNAIMDAKNKMKTLESMTPEILNIFVQLYESNESDKKTVPTNPYGMEQQTQNAANIFGHSTFGQQNKTPQTPANIFGSNTNTGSIFGGGVAAGAQTSSIFGATPNQATGFGVTTSPGTGFGAAPKSSIFGGGTGTVQSSVFGGSAAQTNPNPFNNPNSGVFCSGYGSTTGANAFSLSQLGVATPAAQTGNIFGSATNQIAPAASVFGGSQQTTGFGAPQPSGFGTIQSSFAQTQPQPSLFGQPQPAQSVFQSTQPTSNPFGSATIQSSSSFGVQTTASSHSSGVFGESVFAIQQQQQPAPVFQQSVQQQVQPSFQQTATPFGAPTTATISSSPFIQPVQQQNIFGNSAVNPSPAQPFGQTTPANEDVKAANVYSLLNELTEEQLYWFQADAFEVGKIPTVPPPREMV